jgi:hypothetical protein
MIMEGSRIASLTDVIIWPSKEECAGGMVQRPKRVVMKDVKM